MSLLRNNEIKRFAALVFFLSTALVIAGFINSSEAGILVLITAFLLCLAFFAFTVYRYRQIRKLSDYLRRICAGEHSLDIRDNVEGELSILKNEIYKVTLMLSEYNNQLQHEKLRLSEHMADISHQLKRPITSMMVMVELLSNEDLPHEKRRDRACHGKEYNKGAKAMNIYLLNRFSILIFVQDLNNYLILAFADLHYYVDFSFSSVFHTP